MAFDWRRFPKYRRQWEWYRSYMESPIDDSWYARLFHHRNGAGLAGEATPEYAILGRQGFSHINRVAPTAKVLFVMRSPVQQAWSQFRHFEHKKDGRGASKGSDRAERFWESEYSTLLRDYPKTIDDLVTVFGAERIKFLFYEDVHADRAAAVQSLCTFLEVGFDPRYFPELDERRNGSAPASIPTDLTALLIERNRDIAKGVLDRLGYIPQSWREDFAISSK
jgi:hypothetical protein